MDSVRTQSGMLAMITSQTNEITRDIQVDDKRHYIKCIVIIYYTYSKKIKRML